MTDPRLTIEDQALELLADQKALLISVATGGPQIVDVESTYKERRGQLQELLWRMDLMEPFSFRSLWDWHGTWSSADYPTYASRRTLIRQLAAPTEEALEKRLSRSTVADWGAAPDAWPSLESRLDGLKLETQHASSLDECQDVGRRAREILIDVSAAVFKPEMTPPGEEMPKDGDAKRKIELFLESKASGPAHAELRRMVRTLWDSANAVTHSSSIDRIDSFAVAQSVVALVRIVHEIDRSTS